MRRLWMIGLATAWLVGPAVAADPTGEWLVANGNAHIRIDDCNGALWGIISWEKTPGHLDSENPNPAERTRPTLGLHVLVSLRPSKPNYWEGSVYNAENGKTYMAHL